MSIAFAKRDLPQRNAMLLKNANHKKVETYSLFNSAVDQESLSILKPFLHTQKYDKHWLLSELKALAKNSKNVGWRQSVQVISVLTLN